MASVTIASFGASLDGEQAVGFDRGLRQFNDWLLALPAQSCCILNEADGVIEATEGLGATLVDKDDFGAAAALLGLNRANDSSRQARITVGFDAAARRHLLWVVTPVEAEPPGHHLQVALLVGSAEAGLDLAQRLQAALANATTRHSTTQPLTALSFLLENLLYAFIESSPDEDYLLAKQNDLLEQVERLGTVLSDAEVYDRSAV